MPKPNCIRRCFSYEHRVDQDIRAFLTRILEKDPKSRKWPDLHQEIEDYLTHGAKGMFRWVDYQFDSLRKRLNRSMVKKALRTLPSSLDKTYNRTPAKVAPEHIQYTLRLLQWLCVSSAYVPAGRIMDGLAVAIGETPHFDPESRFEDPDDVLLLCPSFLLKGEWHCEISLQFIHYSVKEFLLSKRKFPALGETSDLWNIEITQANLATAKTCLVDLLHHLDSHPPESPKELGYRFHYESFFKHASTSWPMFFGAAKEDPQLDNMAAKYLNRISYLTKTGHRQVNSTLVFAAQDGLCSITRLLLERLPADSD